MIAVLEAYLQRLMTDAFISADVSSVVLEPMKRENNGSGGYALSAQPSRPPQKMRLIPLSSFAAERNTLEGKSILPDFMLLGLYDAGMDRWDRFVLNGNRYEIVHVQENKEYFTKGETVFLGEA